MEHDLYLIFVIKDQNFFVILIVFLVNKIKWGGGYEYVSVCVGGGGYEYVSVCVCVCGGGMST